MRVARASSGPKKSLAANVVVFMKWGTKALQFPEDGPARPI